MIFLARLLLLAACCYFIPMFTPWWTIFIFSFIIGYLLPGNGFAAFNSGFLGGGLVWLIMSYLIDKETASILSNKMVDMMPVTDVVSLYLLSGLIGGLCAGFGALSGTSFRQIFQKKKAKSFYS